MSYIHDNLHWSHLFLITNIGHPEIFRMNVRLVDHHLFSIKQKM